MDTVTSGPFLDPHLFRDPKSRALTRVGVVDIGSNSVRMVVFDGAARSPAYFYNEKVMAGLGYGLAETGALNPQGRVRALQALKRFQLLAERMLLNSLSLVATAAVREASDGPDFCADVLRETGLHITVIDGQEEARLSAQGVLLGWPGSYGLVCDIGGSSMELAEIRGGVVGKRMTSALGPLKFKDLAGGPKAHNKYIRREINALVKGMGHQRDRLFLVGGSWRAIARIDMHRRAYPLTVLHEYRMDATAVAKTVAYIDKADRDALRQACSISASRMELVPAASRVLSHLVNAFEPRDIAISSYGIREGMLYEQMPVILRDRDPLIEACRFSEHKDARLPGFGQRLFEFVQPLFPDVDATQSRLIQAACLLHDVSWRAHPDFRAELCFETATRANMGGLKHGERVFLGLALLHRYRNKRDGMRYEHLFDLLDPDSQRDAEVLGKAMRFGAMLWLNEADSNAQLSWDVKRRILTLRLEAPTSVLVGEVAQARLQSLANSLNANDITLTYTEATPPQWGAA